MVIPMEPSGSTVTSGEFWRATVPAPRVATSWARPAVEDLEAVGGGGQHVVVAAAGQVGEGDAADDPARGGHRPAGQRRPVRPVQGPHQAAAAGVDALDHLLAAVAEDVADGRARDRVAAEVDPPLRCCSALSEANSVLVSGAPGKKLPVPKAMPVPPPPRKLPTAVDESTVWFVS